MKELRIGNISLAVKDYYCKSADSFSSSCGTDSDYLVKDDPKLWLYVNVTDRCNAGCQFCVSHSNPANTEVAKIDSFRKALEVARPYIYGVSFTGGEPMLYPAVLDELISVTDEMMPDDSEIDIVTNGTSCSSLCELKNIDRLTTIHISRHSTEDERNDRIMGFHDPGLIELKELISSVNDPGKFVLNCVLQDGGVDSMEAAAKYLDMAIDIGVQNSCFITMLDVNPSCKDRQVRVDNWPVFSDSGCELWNSSHEYAQFNVWNRYHDYSYCSCLSGSYSNLHGRTRFYFRSPGADIAPDYCRQLVYTADNKLRDGFGQHRTVIWE